MLDHGEKVLLVDSETMKTRAEDMIEQNNTSVNDKKKTCADCGTSKTPLWRGGPVGPKSLCNACGIRNRKKRRGGTEDNKKLKKSSSGGGNRKFGESLKQSLMDLGIRKRSTVEKQRQKLGEEEQAAVLLMALSYGSVYA